MSVFIETKEFIFIERIDDEISGDFNSYWCVGVVFFLEEISNKTNKKTSRRSDGGMF